jgi:alkylation response protein AidB-like acyl-CoA dehydrogenase
MSSSIDLEVELSAEERAIIDTVHKFAAEVMRPAGEQLDRLADPADVIAADSILWDVFRKYRELGIDEARASPAEGLSPVQQARLGSMISEELGWGDAGLAISLGVNGFPRAMAMMSGNPELIERFSGPDQIGCWAITEPDHGSDMVDFGSNLSVAEKSRPNCIATREGEGFVIRGQKAAWVSNGSIATAAALFWREGEGFVIRGQKAAWVSNGSIATAAALFCAVDLGEGPTGSGVFVVPLDAPGVSKGKPLDKIGQRALNQGEIFFDGLRVPAHYMVLGPEAYAFAADRVLCMANGGMGSCFVGCARAAFELALDYAKERVQGGVTIMRHQSVKGRLFEMFRKVEAARALNRRVVIHNSTSPTPALQYAIASKKVLRDARASMIEDGCNHVLALVGADRL